MKDRIFFTGASHGGIEATVAVGRAASGQFSGAGVHRAASRQTKLGLRLLDSPIARDAQTLAALNAQAGKAERAAAQVWQWTCNGTASNEAPQRDGSGAPRRRAAQSTTSGIGRLGE
ncbi:hypothetical protein QYH69_06140 [Paraburkholderia sp. SARCC-3016]|uniref:hypothetical protein n=1 Tax=Paraburkholderia sp. SARCC-3016 TaxID=3058611 RepID=UPI0028077527|nr:hypothetical protein [Paraburkholderia sp. SARCC-3016]MDQ7976822.1 hypothetical protein [Paraburkholderia sp. SARCC-3016]